MRTRQLLVDWARPLMALAGAALAAALLAACSGGEGPQGPAGAQGAQGLTGSQGPQGPAGPMGAQGAAGPQGPRGSAGPQGAEGPQGPAGQDGAIGAAGPAGPRGAAGQDGAAGPQGPQGPGGSSARETELIAENGVVAWRYVGESDGSWRILEDLSARPQPAAGDNDAMLFPTAPGWEVEPVYTVGEYVGDYLPVGILDGAGAYELDDRTVRVLTNHELRGGQGYAYELASGAQLKGARISYFDIDKTTLEVKDAGLAYDTIVARYGAPLTQEIVDLGDPDQGDLRRFCSSAYYGAGSYGLVDSIYFTGEETGGGQLFALDVASETLYAVPAVGRAAYENITLLDSGDPGAIAIAVGDDRAGAPLLLYIGRKNALGDGSFLDRNGLAQGALYAWVSDAGDASPATFHRTGETRSGRFVEIDIHNPALAGQEGRDNLGYVDQSVQDSLTTGETGARAFQFSRPEDLDVNPENSAQFVLNSTGHRNFPNDLWGTVYVVDVDFADLTAGIRIVYSGDDAGGGQFMLGPDFGLRSPDNLDWANDGYVYQQEDRSIRAFGDMSGQEASIWRMDPDDGALVRIAQVNRNAVLPAGAVDRDPDDLGDWETSGILDITTLLGAETTTLLVNVQAHSLDVDLRGDLVQGGQIVLLRRTEGHSLNLNKLASVKSENGAEIAAFDPGSNRAFVTTGGSVEVLDLSDPSEPALIGAIDITTVGAGVNSVAVQNGVVAAAIEGSEVDSPGTVAFYDAATFALLGTAPAGVLPDMVAFTPDGRYVLTADEGEPSDDYTIDPAGTITVIDISRGVGSATSAQVGFDPAAFDVDALKEGGLRIFGPNADLSNDVEPEYITVSPDSSTAYVVMQENNAIAVVDIARATVTDILPLGFKDHSLVANAMDASNRDDGVNIRNWPVLGLYQPDAIASFQAADGEFYLVTANEGDARDYDGYSEEVRVADLTLDRTAFPDAVALQQDAHLGRLKTTTAHGDTDGDGDHDLIYSYGARSFSIWSAGGELVFDSGADFGNLLKEQAPTIFNSNGLASSYDSRSDDKGAEPEAVAVAKLWGRHYAFVALERAGGIVIYDVTYPADSRLVGYFNDIDPHAEAESAGDLGPEGIAVIPADDSPTGAPLLLVASEISLTVSVFEIGLSNR